MASGFSKLVEEEIASQDLKHFRQLSNNAFYVEFAVTPEISTIVHELYKPLRFNFGVKPQPAHPLQAIHQRFATKQLLTFAGERKPCIEIGPNPVSSHDFLRHNGTHGCCLFSGRDQARYTAAAAHPKVRSECKNNYNRDVMSLASNIPSQKFCTDGFQNCDYQADFAISIHSLYDINPSALAEGFHRHGIKQLRAFMHLHPTICVEEESSDSRNYTTVRTIKDKNGKPLSVRIFFHNDESHAYVHDYDTYRFYHLRNGFSTPYGFGLMFEITNRYGSNAAVTISRVDVDTLVTNQLLLSNINLVKVPNIRKLVSKNFKRGSDIEYINTDREMVTRLYRYLTAREGKQLTHKVAFAYARGQCRRVLLGSVVINQAWDISLEDFNDVVFSVYILARLTLTRHDVVENVAVEEIENLKVKKPWLYRTFPNVYMLFRSLGLEIKEFFGGQNFLPIIDNDADYNAFAKIGFRFYEDIEVTTMIFTDNAVEELQLALPPVTRRRLADDDFTEKPLPVTAVKQEPENSNTMPIGPESDKTTTNEFFDRSDDNACLYYSLFGTQCDKENINNVLFELLEDAYSIPEIQDWLIKYAVGKYKSDKPCSIICEMQKHFNDRNMRFVDDIALFYTFFPGPTKLTLSIDGKTHAVSKITEYETDMTQFNPVPTIVASHVEYSNNHFIGSRPRKGGADLKNVNGLVVSGDPITFHESHIVHGIHSWVRKKDGKLATYNGFARTALRNSIDGEAANIKSIANFKEKRYKHDPTDNVVITCGLEQHSRVYNIISDDYKDFREKFITFVGSGHDRGVRIHMPLVGSGVWNKTKISVSDFVKENISFYQEIHDHAKKASIAIVLHSSELPRFTLNDNGIPYDPFPDTTLYDNTFHARIKSPEMMKHLQHIASDFFVQATQSQNALSKVLEKAHDDIVVCKEFKNKLFDVVLHVGPPGTGKTHSIMTTHTNNRVLYIGPTSSLVNSMAEKYPNVSGLTIHKAISSLYRGAKFDLIIVDECFTVPLPILAYLSDFAPLALVGDPNQIGFIDFQKTHPDMPILQHHMSPLPKVEYTKTYRCPQDIVANRLIQRTYPGITTKSQVKSSIEYVGPKWNPLEKKMPVQRIVFSQNTKSNYPNSITVHEAQGQTFDNVLLTISGAQADRNILSTKIPHVIVAMTRHTQKLFIQEEKPGMFENALAVYMGECTQLDMVMEPTITALPEWEMDEPEDMLTPNTLTNESPDYIPVPAGFNAVAEILSDIYPTTQDIHEEYTFEKLDVDYKHGATARVDLKDIPEDDLYQHKENNKRFPLPQYVKVTDSKRKSATLNTLLSRYTKRTKQLAAADLQNELTILQNVVTKYIPMDEPNGLEKAVAYAGALNAFTNRGHEISDLVDIDCWTDQGVNQVKFNMKQQQKASPDSDPLHKDKAGQGIAAWEKILNFSLCVWCRILEKRMISSEKFIFATAREDTDMLKILDACGADPQYEYVENDFAEFDSSQNNLEHANFLACLERLGCPRMLLDNFSAMMNIRDVSCGWASVKVKSKKDSGRVDTLVGNTLFGLCVLVSIIDEERSSIKNILVKGDDSVIIGKNIVIDQDRIEQLHGKCGYTMKIKAGRSAEFTNMIINANGAAINIPKVSAKVFSRIYTTEEKFDEYRIAVGDLLRSTRNTFTAQNQCIVNAVHYGQTVENMDLLLSALHLFANGKVPYRSLINIGNLARKQDD
nr:nonstructural polyprotein [Hepeviridae sp.]